jgi:hypothetical protein
MWPMDQEMNFDVDLHCKEMFHVARVMGREETHQTYTNIHLLDSP